MSVETRDPTVAPFAQTGFDALSEHGPVERMHRHVVDDGPETVFATPACTTRPRCGTGTSRSPGLPPAGRTSSGRSATTRTAQTSDGGWMAIRAHQKWQLIPGPPPPKD